MAFTAYPAAGETFTAAMLQSLISELRPITASKAVDTSRNSTTSETADPELVLTGLQAGHAYDVAGLLLVSSAANAAGDFKHGWAWTGTMAVTMAGVGPHNSLASGSQVDGEFTFNASDSSSPSATIPYGASIAGVGVLIRARVAVSVGGNLTLTWAQLSSNANNTTLLAGSWITATPVS